MMQVPDSTLPKSRQSKILHVCNERQQKKCTTHKQKTLVTKSSVAESLEQNKNMAN